MDKTRETRNILPRDEHLSHYHLSDANEKGFALWGSHTHEFYEFYYHIRGIRQMEFAGNVFDLWPGWIYIIPPLTPHGLLYPEAGGKGDHIILYCTGDTLRRLGFGRVDLEEKLCSAVTCGSCQFPLTKEGAAAWRSLPERLHHSVRDTGPDTDYENHIVLASLMRHVLDAVSGRAGAPAQQSTEPRTLISVLHYVSAHYSAPISLDQIADSIYLSSSMVSHGFIQHTGCSVYDYVLMCRIALARRLILKGVPLKKVCTQCGFTDYSNFLRGFCRQMGMSPREYRKRHMP